MKSAYASTFHKDGTVTIWNVYTQGWERISAARLIAQCERPFGNLIMPTLNDTERARIRRIAGVKS